MCPLARKLIQKTVVPQFNNSEDFAIASEKRNTSVPNSHLGLSQRESLWVCVTTRYRGSFCLQARLDPAFGSLTSAFSLQLPLCPLPPTCLPYSSQSVTGWMISPRLEESSAPMNHMPTPVIGGEVNSIIIIMGERKERGDFPE